MLVEHRVARRLCGSPPASRPASKPAAAPELEKSERLCNEQARALFFDKIGVPEGEQAVDLAFDERHVWVLFRPSRLLQVDRGTVTGKVEVRMLNGAAGESWSAITLDPRDGSLWIAAAPFHFKRVTPELRVETVRLPQIKGEGTFAQIALTAEEIYARPLVAEHELWRFDRTGKLLGDAFPRAGDEAAPAAIREGWAGSMRLERGRNGRLLAWRWSDGTVYLAGPDGVWTPTEEPILAAVPDPSVLSGTAVGTRREQWFFPGQVRNLFYLHGEPILLGGGTIPAFGVRATVLLLQDGARLRPVLEECAGAGQVGLLAVRADDRGYAAITEAALIQGSFEVP